MTQLSLLIYGNPMLDRKEQILDVAGDLLQTRSFSAFSYQDISDRIGISKASIHHHFPTKDDLGKALAVRYRISQKNALEEISRRYDRPWDQLDAYIAMTADIIKSGNKICPVGSLQAEHNIISKDMQEELNHLCDLNQSWLAGVLNEGRKKGIMTFPGTSEDQAALIQAAIQGALQNARAEGPKQFSAVIRQLKNSMKGKGG